MSNSFASNPAFGSPCILSVISMYTNPLFTSGRTLYSSMISCGICLTGIIVYSGRFIGVLR